MPKKTRKEKLLAQQRRVHFVSPTSSLPSSQETSTYQAVSYALPSISPTSRSVSHHDDPSELIFIKRDLLTTVLLAALAIGIELVLYFRWQ